MKTYLIHIKYKDNERSQALSMHDTFENVHEWVNNTLPIDNIEHIVIQHISIIETLKFEKDEQISENSDNSKGNS